MLDVLPEPFYRGKFARAGALAAIAVLALLAAAAAAQLVWTLVAMGDDPLPPPAPIAAEALAAAAQSRASTQVGQWHLFGNALPTRDTRSVAIAPDTGLDLTLRGVFAGDDPKDGRAIIGDRGGVDRGFAVGDAIADGVTLDAVYPDRVMLMRNGQVEALRMPRADAAASAGTVVQGGGNAPGARERRPTSDGGNAMVQPGTAAPIASAPFVTPPVTMGTAQYDAATAKLGMDPAELARRVSVLPVLENGQFVGVRLSGARDVPAIAQLGLLPDDIVTEVNGIALDSPARAAEVAQNLATATTVNVTVRRDGRTQNLSVSLR